ncbi:MAG: DUF2183 domain-containing protein [Verrucomicrobiaceae bacterium]|nr:MAG: DUF2183 domain-containing protein [Verrucomicrobiaceae bacterium]
MNPLLPAVAVICAAVPPASVSAAGTGCRMISPVKADETVLFFTTAASPAEDQSGMWLAEVHGIIFENEQSRLIVALLRKMLGIEEASLTAEERVLLRQRLALFTVDCERGKALRIVLGGQTFDLPASGPNGHFRTTLRLPASMTQGHRELSFTAVLRPGDTRRFEGKILLPADGAAGPLVISDLDDTIKLSEVGDRTQLRLNTFCRPFRAVPGMAPLYQRWQTVHQAQFHYVSGSPWQLYGPLETFIRSEGFPEGTWHLKHLRLKDPSTLRIFFGPHHVHKTAGIRAILERWPRRPVILVGDTGEQDPEIYADLAQRYPDRIHRIFLRNVTAETRSGPRLAGLFQNVPPEKWRLFENAAEVPEGW